MGAEEALVRSQFQSGTHTLAVALFGLLRAGDTLLEMCIRDRILSGSVMPVASTYRATRTLYSSAMPSLENTSCGTAMAVSYTHLDVYKRQAWSRPCRQR